MVDNAIIEKELFSELDGQTSGSFFLATISAAGDTIPAWWSQYRDIEIRRFTKNSDHLSGTVNTLREMMTAITGKVIPRDNSIKSHVKDAELYHSLLFKQTSSRTNLVERGWDVGYGAFIEDYLSQDNGGWMVIDDGERGDQPVTGKIRKLVHLDSGRCWRTQNSELPLQYNDIDGAMYLIHRSRIINLTSQSAPVADMFGVGFCAVSRCINITQHLIDIGRYKQEKLGSRPHRGILSIQDSAGSDKEAQKVSAALTLADQAMNNQGLTRYGKTPVVSVRGNLNLLDLASLPDGYNEMESVQLGMAVLSLAFGVDMRQLSFALGVSGQTKADAQVQHLKMRGKGPGYIIQSITQRINNKFLPAHLKLVFDYQDDEQDMLNAQIRKGRAERREKDLALGTTSIRVEREIMLEEGEISEAQFTDLELNDGRLPDGESILALFQSPEFADVLPDIDSPPEVIEERRRILEGIIMSNPSRGVRGQTNMALAAIEHLQQNRPKAEADEPISLNGLQVSALRDTLAAVKSGELGVSNAVDVITSMGVPQAKAERMANEAAGGESVEQLIDEEVVEVV